MQPIMGKHLRLKLRLHPEADQPAQGTAVEIYDPETGAMLLVDRFTIEGDMSGDLVKITLRCYAEIEVVAGFPFKGRG